MPVRGSGYGPRPGPIAAPPPAGPAPPRAPCPSRSHSSGSEMLTATGVASPPAARIASTVRSREPSSGCSPSRRGRAAQTTRPPSAANARAISAPMPRLPPVTMTDLPSSLPMIPSLPVLGPQVDVHERYVLRHGLVVVGRDEDAVGPPLLLDHRLQRVEPLHHRGIVRFVHGDQQRLAAGARLGRGERYDPRESEGAQGFSPRFEALLELAGGGAPPSCPPPAAG